MMVVRAGHLTARTVSLDDVEETDDLLIPLSLHAATNDLARCYIECGEQRGGAVPGVIVGHGAAAAMLKW